MPIKKVLKKSMDEIRRQRKLFIDHYVKQVILIFLGTISATVGLNGFLLPNGLFDGGVTGISLLTNYMSGISIPLLIMIINIPFILIGYKQIGWKFALKTSLAIITLSLLIEFLHVPQVTDDKLLTAVFGGFFLGAGIGFAIRGGAVIDGTEILALFINRVTTFTVGDFIAIFNICLFAIAAILVNIETALYSMLTYLSASKTVDFILNGIEEYIGVTIVSDFPIEIQEVLIEQLGRKATIYKGEGDLRYAKQGDIHKRNIIYCVVTRLEVPKLLYEVQKIDGEAFIVQTSVRDVKGGLVKRRALH